MYDSLKYLYHLHASNLLSWLVHVIRRDQHRGNYILYFSPRNIYCIYEDFNDNKFSTHQEEYYGKKEVWRW